VWLETVRADDTPCADGEEGRILVTTMANGAMPLLRYDIGDIGVLGGACGCGLSLPKLTLTVGRERQLFRFSDGADVVPIFRMEKFSDIFPVRQWQLAQTGPEAVELRFSSDVADEKLKFDEIAGEIRQALGRPVDVAFRRGVELLGPSGKLEPSIRLV
jgi:phenylacetate-CoA ligase